MFQKKISIIVPVYNNEETIQSCLNSIQGQTYENIEVIVVNDGSTDGTLHQCNMIQQEDARCKIFTTINQGVSAARNFGISQASGELIGFVDADDLVAPNMFEVLIDRMERHQADICVCKYQYIKNAKKIKKQEINDSIRVLSQAEFSDELFTNQFVGGFLWNKVFRRKLLAGYQLNSEIDILEDMEFICSILPQIEKVVYCDISFYGYYINMESATNNADKLFDEFTNLKYCKFYDYIVNLYFKEDEKKKNIIQNAKVNAIVGVAHQATLNTWQEKYQKELQKLLRKYIFFYLAKTKNSYQSKIRYVLLLFPKCYRYLYRKIKSKKL
ncbi:MAG: glycosyltransferase family 2 protein [Lachnospiraceae bacterium]